LFKFIIFFIITYNKNTEIKMNQILYVINYD